MPTRTAYSVVSDYPSRPSWGSRLVICVLKKPHNPLKVLIVADQITTHEYSSERYDDDEWFFPGSEHVNGTIEGAMKAGLEAYPS